ncbi:MAG TPA: immunoglobulin-like domain-containing protein, partial [Fluviicoccus sp.]|nr:immunoglobulin-like domain-containing protein [Fluviicoccus sp.]
STASVTEGGSIVYTAAVNNAVTGSPLVVTLSNGQTITIPVGQSSADSTPFAVRGDDAYVQGTQALNVGISGTSGGNYEALTTTSTVSTNVVDDADATTVSISGSASVAEGATGSYTIALTSTAQTDVTVNLSYSGTAADGSDYTGIASVVIAAGSSSANFNIATLDDAIAEGSENFTITIASASGGSFESLVVSPTNGSITTGIVDNDIATVSLSATASLTEAGGNIVYTATLTQAPVSDLTVTLSNGSAITIIAGQLTGTTTVAVAADEDVYVDPTNISATISSTSGGGISVAIDPTAATTSITDTIDATTVTLTASTASVTEGGSIVYTAAVNNAVTGSPLVVTLSNGQTITIPVGQSSADS